jgi:large subunit ribosomal protein L3
MGQASRPRRGSLQYWPRKRAKKFLPSVNWSGIQEKNESKGLLGFIGYKVGMKSAFVKDATADSMTKNKRISIPITIIECPPMRIYSVRFYKNDIVMTEVLGKNFEKELKKRVKLPKTESKKIEDIKDYDDVRIIVYSNVKKTGIKKKPDMIEIALNGTLEEKINFVKERIGKEIRVNEIFEKMGVVDIRGLTKGKGNVGPIKRFGAALRQHKSEKGLRKIGSLGPWHPARVIFRVPMAGQLGMFTRITYNNKIIEIGSATEKDITPSEGFKHFGKIKTDYVVLNGSVQGPSKRPLILTKPLRLTKKQNKKNFELIDIR